jgi:hypothetical protein
VWVDEQIKEGAIRLFNKTLTISISRQTYALVSLKALGVEFAQPVWTVESDL